MLEVAEALAEVLRHAKPLAPVMTPLSPARARSVLADDVRADADSPPFPKSLRDGYAVRAADCATPDAELRVIEEIAAGAVPTRAGRPGRVRPHLHRCADARRGRRGRDAGRHASRAGDRVRITDAEVKPRQWVFRRGHRDAGRRCGAAGRHGAQPGGARRARERRADAVRVCSPSRGSACSRPATNSSSADEQPGPGQIRNTNGPMLAAQVVRAGGDVRDTSASPATTARRTAVADRGGTRGPRMSC